jgi:hypothetical protein
MEVAALGENHATHLARKVDEGAFDESADVHGIISVFTPLKGVGEECPAP